MGRKRKDTAEEPTIHIPPEGRPHTCSAVDGSLRCGGCADGTPWVDPGAELAKAITARMPPDHILEADFDPHEAPTKPGTPPGLSDEILDVRDDMRTLLSASAVLFEHMTYSIGSANHTARIGEARFALSELAKKYGVTT